MEKYLDKAHITGLILAGGRGIRMGAKDKGLQLFCGQPLFQHALNRLRPQVGTILINANQHLDQYQQTGLTVLSDEPLSYAGPLAGFATGLAHCKTPYLLAIPCDCPFFPEDLAEKLGKALIHNMTDIAFAITGQHSPFKAQPVFCLMKKSVQMHLETFLASGQRKIDAWYTSLKTSEVHFQDEEAFFNINTPEELKYLENKSRNLS